MTATQPTTVRDRRFDGSIRKNGLSKLMRDIFVLPENKKNMEEEKIDLENGYVNIAKIIEQTAYELGVEVEGIKGRSRARKFVTARSIICFIARYTTTLSLKQIGTEISMYSPKDHSSVIHATQKAFDFIHNPDTEFIVLFERVRQRLDAHYNITFDLEDLTHMPSWYKNMLKDK